LRRRWSLKGSEKIGSSLDSMLFEKMKCIFSIAPVEKLEKSWDQTLALETPDAEPARPM